MFSPFVSVLIDTDNHERFIEQAIVSVLEQDVSPAEKLSLEIKFRSARAYITGRAKTENGNCG